MKCVILAGGSGDSLWPLSRRQFPKQFMKIKEGRSLLQETVVRNMPFCEEFIIVTNESYKNIVNGQMKAEIISQQAEMTVAIHQRVEILQQITNKHIIYNRYFKEGLL